MRVPLKSNYHLPSSQKEFEQYKLLRKTKEIKRRFSQFFTQLQQHMLKLQTDGTLDVSVIKSHIILYDKTLKTPMRNCKSLQNIFEIISLPEYSSFLNYELIKLLTDYGSEKNRSDFIDYKKKLQCFLESRMIEYYSPKGEKLYAVLIDDSIIDEMADLIELQNRVKIILGHDNITLLHWNDLTSQPKHTVEERSASVTFRDNLHKDASQFSSPQLEHSTESSPELTSSTKSWKDFPEVTVNSKPPSQSSSVESDASSQLCSSGIAIMVVSITAKKYWLHLVTISYN